MYILVIGNGFDRAHGLPTTYRDFLSFVEIVLTGICENPSATFPVELAADYVKRMKYRKIVEELERNYWYRHFRDASIQSGWVDFENEILRVIRQLSDMERAYKDQPGFTYAQFQNSPSTPAKSFFLGVLRKCGIRPQGEGTLLLDLIREAADLLENHLFLLKRALEIYLDDFINEIDPPVRFPLLYNGPIRYDGVISFNYTNTFTRLYGNRHPGAQLDYIHGLAEAAREPEQNNMVLGTDEFLSEEERKTELTFIGFKKYFQRIYYKNDHQYKTWLRLAQDRGEQVSIDIYGHSLDLSDREILLELLNGKNHAINIHYHDEYSHRSHILNAVQLLGPETLNAYVRNHPNGIDPQIGFHPQGKLRDMERWAAHPAT